MKCGNLVEPWYTPSIKAFLTLDVPRTVGNYSLTASARDVATLERRLAAEGESFLTKTLPALGKAIDLALQGHMPLVTSAFKKAGRSALPQFLGALLQRVFQADGWIAVNPCIKSIRLLRQICYWCKKIEKGYSDESQQKAVAKFIATDRALPSRSDLPTGGILGIARALVERMFKNIVPLEKYYPKHGPGAVAAAVSTVGKRALDVSYTALESVFRPIPWFRSLRDAAESPWSIYERPRCEFGYDRLALVEKDSKGPRLIGLPPAEYMWIQQAIKSWMYDHIETRSFARRRINFTDQSINRFWATVWAEVETLDMSEASDRNAFALVEVLFERTKLWRYLRASRTFGSILPDGRLLNYRKFAPMGSAVCFPVEAVVFYCLAVAALHQAGMPLFLACRKTFVYGDDLIVPRGFYKELSDAFESVGLKFNSDKCCIHGKFRESCGMDAFAGEDVTPVRMKKVYPNKRNGQTVLVGIVKHANSLMEADYWSASKALRTAALREFPELRNLRLPTSDKPLPILAWTDYFVRPTVKIRTNKESSISFVKGWVWKPKRLLMNPADEARYLRESLSHGGPVGHLVGYPKRDNFREVPVKGRTSRPCTVRRELDARYAGRLRKLKVPIVLEISQVRCVRA